MGIHGAFVTGVPMVVISGESMTYREQPEFDPGAQWVNNLSIVGGTTSLVDGIVKYASVAGSPYTLYESIIRAGELAQRQPAGPTYLSVSTETLMAAWTPPANPRTIPPTPRMLTAPEDIEKLAAQISKAKRPVVLTEGAGKTSNIAFLQARLEAAGKTVVLTREPGGEVAACTEAERLEKLLGRPGSTPEEFMRALQRQPEDIRGTRSNTEKCLRRRRIEPMPKLRGLRSPGRADPISPPRPRDSGTRSACG